MLINFNQTWKHNIELKENYNMKKRTNSLLIFL